MAQEWKESISPAKFKLGMSIPRIKEILEYRYSKQGQFLSTTHVWRRSDYKAHHLALMDVFLTKKIRIETKPISETSNVWITISK